MIRRIITQPTTILDKSAPYWQGARCEQLAAERIAARAAEKAARRSKRGTADIGADHVRGRGPRSQSQILRRLERALKRRKTEAGRQSVLARIEELKAC